MVYILYVQKMGKLIGGLRTQAFDFFLRLVSVFGSQMLEN